MLAYLSCFTSVVLSLLQETGRNQGHSFAFEKNQQWARNAVKFRNVVQRFVKITENCCCVSRNCLRFAESYSARLWYETWIKICWARTLLTRTLKRGWNFQFCSEKVTSKRRRGGGSAWMRCGVLTGLKIGSFLKAPAEYFVQVYIY